MVPLSSLFGDCAPAPLSSQPSKLRDRATARSPHKNMLGAPKPLHKDMLGAPKAPKAAPRKAPKAGPPTDTQPEDVTTPWHGGIVDYVRHLFG